MRRARPARARLRSNRPSNRSATVARRSRTSSERSEPGARGQMVRIATFNVNGVNGRLPVLLKWLTATDYDIVCLQELKTSDEKFPAEAIREAGYSAIWHGQKSY